MRKVFRDRKGVVLAVLGLSSMIFSPSFAAGSTAKKLTVWKDQLEKTDNWHSINWRTAMSFSAGAAFGNKIGNSQFIPIFDPAEDQFFDYVAHSTNQSEFIWGVFLGLEVFLTQNWYLQSGFSYYQPTMFHPKGVVTQGVDALSMNTYFYHYDIQARQVLFENKLLYNMTYSSMSFHPYISAGIGISSNTSSDYAVNILPPFTTFSNQFGNQTDNSFSYRVGLGLDYDVTNWCRVGVGYRFADFGKAGLGNASINLVPTFNHLAQSHLYTNEVLGQLTFVI